MIRYSMMQDLPAFGVNTAPPSKHAVSGASPHFDRSNLQGAIVDRDDGEFALEGDP
jgi:hypothetical protein